MAFKDFNLTKEEYKYTINKLVQAGVVTGFNKQLRPKDFITKKELIYILSKLQ